MSTATKYTSPFPPLELTSGDEARLEDKAYFLVQSAISEYQDYLYKDQRAVDHDQWKFMKRKQKIRVYVERSEKEIRKRRKHATRQAQESSCCSTSEVESFSPDSTWTSLADSNTPVLGADSIDTDSHRSVRSSLGVPAFLVAGSIEGTLEDAMYGVMCPTVDAMRIKSSYVQDNIANTAVLAMVISPTIENPFRSLSVKWVEKAQPMYLDALVKNHDAVILESTGITSLMNGERVGYVLLHSVEFPETSPLDTVVRGGLSVCMLFREDVKTSVDVFLIGNVNPVSGMTKLLVVKSAIEGLISVWKFVECARMKKLAWALNQQHSCSIEYIPDVQESQPHDSGSVRPCCTHCKRRASRHRRRNFLGRIKKRAVCNLCAEYVCSSCKVKQKLSYVPQDTRQQQQQQQQQQQLVRQRELTFCALCIHVAVIRTSSVAVATEEADAMTRNSAGHKSMITSWLRGMLDQPLCRYTQSWRRWKKKKRLSGWGDR